MQNAGGSSPGGGPAAPVSKAKKWLGLTLTLVGGLILLWNGLQFFGGHGSNLLTIVGAGLLITGYGISGQLKNKKIF